MAAIGAAHAIAAAAFVPFGSVAQVRGSTLYWDANGATASQTDGAGAWLGTNQWWTGSANTNWADGSDAVFGFGGAAGAVTLASPATVNSLTFNYFTSAYTLGSSGQAITLMNGISKNANSGAVTFTSPIVLGAAQTWTNNSTSALVVSSTVDNGGFTLTVDGSGNTSFDSGTGILSGGGGLTKNGSGVLILGGAAPNPVDTFTGAITINGGEILLGSNGFGTGNGNITINNGAINQYFGNSLSRGLGAGAGQIQILGGTSGFSGQGATNSSFTITGLTNNELVWGSQYFNPAVFLLQSANTNTNGKGSMSNNIDLNGSDRTITSLQNTDGAASSGFTLSGVIRTTSGTAGLIKTGPGNLILSGADTYNGATSIQQGSITLSGSGTINNTSALNLSGGGTLRLVNTGQLSRLNAAAPITSNGGGISYENSSGANNYTQTLGAISLNQGNFNLVETTNQAGAGSQTLTVGGSNNLTVSGASTVAFSAATTGPQAAGSKNMFVVTGGGTTAAGQIIGPWATVGTAANAQTDYAVYSSDYVVPAAIAATTESNWTSTSQAYSWTNVPKAATTLGATRNIAALRLTTQTGDAVSFATSSSTITLSGHAFNVGDPVVFTGTTAPANLANNTVYYVVSSNQGAGTFSVSATPGGAAVSVGASAGTAETVIGGFNLSTGNNLGTNGILNGASTVVGIVSSGGSITLPTTSAGNLYVNTGSAGMLVNAPIVDNTGKLTLVKSGSAGNLILNGANTFSGDIAINAGTLQLGTNKWANNATLGNTGTGAGNFAGNIFIGGGAQLDIQTNSNQTLSGNISGDGSIVKRYSGTLTLSGNNTYTGKTTLVGLTVDGAGTLSVSSFNSVNGGTPLLASSSLGCPTTVANGTIDLGSGAVQSTDTLKYTGSGETTDRVINFVNNNNNSSRNVDASGTGLLKFTSTPTSPSTIGNIGLTGTGSGEFVGGLPFAFNNLTKSGAGTWTLDGSVGNFGTTTINSNGGTLKIGGAGSFSAGYYTRPITLTGGTLQYSSSANQVLTGVISGGGALVKDTGASTLTLAGASTYTGATTVNSGTLNITGSLGNTAVTVANNATLAGNGTIGGAVAINGTGILAPSVVTGTPTGPAAPLHINASVAFASTATFAVNIASTSAYDQVQFGTTATLGAATLTVNDGGYIPQAGDQFWVLDGQTGSSAIADQFGSSTVTGSATGATYAITYNVSGQGDPTGTGNDVLLTVTAVPEPASLALIGLGAAGLLIRRRRCGAMA